MRQVPRAGSCHGSGWLGTAVWAQSSLWARPKLSVPFHDILMPLLSTQLPSLLLCFCPKSPLPKSSCTQFSLSVCFLGNLRLKGSRTLSHSEQLCFDDPDGAMISAEHPYLLVHVSAFRLSSGLGESPPSALAASPALGAGAAEAWPVLELCCLGRSDWLRVDEGLELGQEHPSAGFTV